MPARFKDNSNAPADILLVDDNKNGLLARTSVLQEVGYTIHALSDPREALRLIDQRPFDLIVTDYKMPLCDGIELIRRVRQNHADIPIILISGFIDTLGLTEASTGANAVIQKSANEVQQLLRTVARLLKKTARKPPASTPKSSPSQNQKGRGA